MGTVSAVALEISWIPVGMVVASEDNRRAFVGPDDQNAGLLELAASIKAQGILEPLLGRPHPALGDGYIDLRAGARRLRAAKLAGLEEVPVIVRPMTDEEAFEVTIAENLQREDLLPIEEAGNIELLRTHGWTYEQIADRLGRSAKWVARRLSLMELSAAWREASVNELIWWPGGVFEMVARFPHGTQDAMLEVFRDDYLNQGYPPTPDDARAICRSYLHSLEAAPWALDDLSFHGCLSCAECPKRSDHEPLLFDDADFQTLVDRTGKKYVEPGARCLDAACWKLKQGQFLSRRLKDVQTRTAEKPILVTDYSTVKQDFELLDVAVVSNYQVQKCKKADAGAQPFVTTDGKMFWGKQLEYGAGAGAERAAVGGKKKSLSLEEKRARLAKRRCVAVYQGLLEKLDFTEGRPEAGDRRIAVNPYAKYLEEEEEKNIPLDPPSKGEGEREGRPEAGDRRLEEEGENRPETGDRRLEAELGYLPTGHMALRMALAFGSRWPNLNGDAWDDHEVLGRMHGAVLAVNVMVQALGVVRVRIQKLIQSASYSDRISMEEARSVCSLMGWDLAGMEREAELAIPEPASWEKGEVGRVKGEGGERTEGAKKAGKALKNTGRDARVDLGVDG